MYPALPAQVLDDTIVCVLKLGSDFSTLNDTHCYPFLWSFSGESYTSSLNLLDGIS